MNEYKWYLFCAETYGNGHQEAFNTREEAEEYLTENYDSDYKYTLVLGQEYQFELWWKGAIVLPEHPYV